jgi:hypothetical protein
MPDKAKQSESVRPECRTGLDAATWATAGPANSSPTNTAARLDRDCLLSWASTTGVNPTVTLLFPPGVGEVGANPEPDLAQTGRARASLRQASSGQASALLLDRWDTDGRLAPFT